MYRSVSALPLGLLLINAAGCGGDTQAPVVQDPAAQAVEKATVNPATTGTIRGMVRVTGEFPTPKKVSFGSDAACAKGQDGPVYFDTALAADGKLQNVFVWVKQGLEGYAFETPTREVVVDQRGCMYLPHIVGVQVGQPVAFVNSDATTHNVHTEPKKGRGENFSMATKGMRTRRTFNRAQVMMKTKCDIHPWMSAWIGVVPHPYFAISSADGGFEISGLPPGEYVLEAWHEKLGVLTQPVSVAASDIGKADFMFTIP
jgi:plastocyanin